MPLPDFLVIGAARCGTTSLHYYLDQHPEICMSSVKEPNHFIFDHGDRAAVPLIHDDARLIAKSVPERTRYERLFTPKPGERVLGEASPLYLYVRETPALADAALPEGRFIASVRHPAERAWSHFLHVYRGDPDGAEPEFRRAVEAEVGEGYTLYRTGTHFLRLGRYAEQLRRWHDVVGPERVHVVVYDDLEADTPAVLRDLAAFVGVDPSFPFDTSVQYNPSGVTKNRALRSLRAGASKVQPWVKSVLPPKAVAVLGKARARVERPTGTTGPGPELRAVLADYYADDLAELESMLGRDLSAWRE